MNQFKFTLSPESKKAALVAVALLLVAGTAQATDIGGLKDNIEKIAKLAMWAVWIVGGIFVTVKGIQALMNADQRQLIGAVVGAVGVAAAGKAVDIMTAIGTGPAAAFLL